MIVDTKKVKISVTDVISAVLAVLFLIGIRMWFPVCEPVESGFMSCHWAGEVLKALSVVILVLCAAHIALADRKVKLGMSVSQLGVYVFAFCVPGRVIPLCKMAEMQCRSHTQLWTIVFMILFMLTSLADIVFHTAAASNEKHTRKKGETE